MNTIFGIIGLTLLSASCSSSEFSAGAAGAAGSAKSKKPSSVNKDDPSSTIKGGDPSSNIAVEDGGQIQTFKVHFQKLAENDAGLRCATFESNAAKESFGCNHPTAKFPSGDHWTQITYKASDCNLFKITIDNGSGAVIRNTDNAADLPYMNFVHVPPNQFKIKINDNNDTTNPNDMHKFADFYYMVEFFDMEMKPVSNVGMLNVANAGCK